MKGVTDNILTEGRVPYGGILRSDNLSLGGCCLSSYRRQLWTHWERGFPGDVATLSPQQPFLLPRLPDRVK